MSLYEENIQKRSFMKFWLGFFARLGPYLNIQWKLHKMRNQGAQIGSNIGIQSSITLPASKNLVVGDHVSFHSNRIDVRAPLKLVIML